MNLNYIVETHDLTKQYPRTTACDNVSIHVEPQSIYGFIGLNGAGKTTLLRMLTGLTMPTSGGMSLFGGDTPEALRAGRRRLGSIIEHPVFFSSMSATDNLKHHAMLTGKSYDRIPAVLAQVGLADTGKKKAKDFSLGMRQRLALGIALMTDPELLILDEPANGLDPAGILEMRDTLRSLAASGTTIIISSHILPELAQFATHYGIIHGGRLITELSATELAERSAGYVKLSVSDTKAATAILKEKGLAFNVQPDGTIRVTDDKVDTGALNAALFAAGVAVNGIARESEDLESFFMTLTNQSTREGRA